MLTWMTVGWFIFSLEMWDTCNESEKLFPSCQLGRAAIYHWPATAVDDCAVLLYSPKLCAVEVSAAAVGQTSRSITAQHSPHVGLHILGNF